MDKMFQLSAKTCSRDKIMSGHTRDHVAGKCPRNMLQPHFPVCVSVGILSPCYMSSLHVPVTFPSVCTACDVIAASCRCNNTPRVRAPQDGISEQAKSVVETLREQGYCYVDDFHGEDTARKILSEVTSLHQRQKFTDGELVSTNGNGSTLNKKIRDDKIVWIDGRETNCETISEHMNAINALMRQCNALIDEYDIEHRTKAMVACYPGQGTGYKRHVDNPSQDGRCITTLYYLNPGWTEEKGGMLKLFPGGGEQSVRILPKLDRLLLFWSDRRNPHEVEPSHDVRYAITLWYFDKNERAKFRQRQETLEKKEASNKKQENSDQDDNSEDRETTK